MLPRNSGNQKMMLMKLRIKNGISAFRFEQIEIIRASGMNTQSATGPSGKYLYCK